MEGAEKSDEQVWIRLEQAAYIPDSGTFGQIPHKDYILYRDGADAYVAVQDPKDLERWKLFQMKDYGDWLEKEIRIHIRMTTGL